MVHELTSKHIHSEYDAALDSLRSDFSLMFDLVEEMLRGASCALADGNLEAGEAARKLDRRVDDLDRQVCESIVKILAQWQPLASDLRFILACSRSVGHLERVGDYIRNICKRVRHIIGHDAELLDFSKARLLSMTDHVGEMLGLTRVAFLRQDSGNCSGILEMDTVLDSMHKDVFNLLRENITLDSGNVQAILEVMLVSKNLERMGDHITNIAEMVVFSVSAETYERRQVVDGAE